MSKISEQLIKYAQEEKQAHEEYIKDFSVTALAGLMRGGVDKDKAVLITKEACLRDENLAKSITRATILEKTAQYIEALEEENVKLAAKIQTTVWEEKKAEMPEHLQKLEKLGFTKEELEAMKDVPVKVLEKVAASTEAPAELGRGVGPKVSSMDPLLEFILS